MGLTRRGGAPRSGARRLLRFEQGAWTAAAGIAAIFLVGGLGEGPRLTEAPLGQVHGNVGSAGEPLGSVEEGPHLPWGAFWEPDGRLRVDCDRHDILCDDEEA